MARYVDIHPDNPQPRLVTQVVEALRNDELIAYPTDSGYALGAQLGNRDGRDRILKIRELDDRHHFTLLGLLFGGVGDHETRSSGLLGFDLTNDDAIFERLDADRHG